MSVAKIIIDMSASSASTQLRLQVQNLRSSIGRLHWVAYDAEWTSTSGIVSVFQLSTPDTAVVVYNFHASKPPSEIIGILTDSTVTKIMCDFRSDAYQLLRSFQVVATPCVCIQELACLLDPPHWPAPPGLQSLVAVYLRLDLVKSKELTRSNWNGLLNDSQIQYAFNDVYATAAVFERLTLRNSARLALSQLTDKESSEISKFASMDHDARRGKRRKTGKPGYKTISTDWRIFQPREAVRFPDGIDITGLLDYLPNDVREELLSPSYSHSHVDEIDSSNSPCSMCGRGDASATHVA
ncbi:ribonuclease H-like domain-containing protein [Auriculariales sp. MPI-PUGE-AT-0066]|nr:ribonuclease H-like domain-containing protein [Auriculariales sp. MPI-PUGE-AT-0066]